MTRPKQPTTKRAPTTRSGRPSAPALPRGRDGVAWAIKALGDLIPGAMEAGELDLVQRCIAKIGDFNLGLSREARADERLELQRARFEHQRSELAELQAIEERMVAHEQRMDAVEQTQRQHSPAAIFDDTTDTTARKRV